MPKRNHAVVLVVEDEPLIRLAAVDMVEDAGYTVIEAGNADEAIALLERHPEIRIVFTDVEMPGSINGIKLANFIRDRWPPIEIIITSGAVPRENVTLPNRGVFLPKPYRPEELARQLDSMG